MATNAVKHPVRAAKKTARRAGATGAQRKSMVSAARTQRRTDPNSAFNLKRASLGGLRGMQQGGGFQGLPMGGLQPQPQQGMNPFMQQRLGQGIMGGIGDIYGAAQRGIGQQMFRPGGGQMAPSAHMGYPGAYSSGVPGGSMPVSRFPQMGMSDPGMTGGGGAFGGFQQKPIGGGSLGGTGTYLPRGGPYQMGGGGGPGMI